MTQSPPKQPASRASADSTRTDEVRQTAARLFGESGYSATTMNDIADVVGVLPGSLYHHFSSKEEIAIDLLASFDRALTNLATSALRRLEADEPPEDLVRRLAGDVTALSFDHAGAVRLRAHEAPSVSTERLSAAMRFSLSTFDRAWKATVGTLPNAGIHPGVNLGLLRFVLQHLTVEAPVYYLADMEPREVARRLCDALLHGLVVDCPDDDALDNSAALKAALDAMATWRLPDRTDTTSDRDKILEAARLTFARRGYEATTIREIANAAEVRMGTLYRRVESKESILREIIEGYASRLDQAFQAVLTSGSSEPEALDALARVYVHASRRFREESQIVKFGWRGRESTSSPFHDYYIQTQRRLHHLEELLTRGIKAEALHPIGHPEDMALDFRSILWSPFAQHGRTSELRSHTFLRESLLRGALTER